MCDLIPIEAWRGNALEPACGNGNFLVEMARRKLAIGMSAEEAASTLFGIDIQPDNVAESIARLETVLPGTRDILERNIICGDMLTRKTAAGEHIWFLPDDDNLCEPAKRQHRKNQNPINR